MPIATTTDNIDMSIGILVTDLNNRAVSAAEITTQLNSIVDTWKTVAFDGTTPAVRSINWDWGPGEPDTVYIGWVATDEPNASVLRSYTFSHLTEMKKNTDANDAYDRAMKGI